MFGRRENASVAGEARLRKRFGLSVAKAIRRAAMQRWAHSIGWRI
jgi:hypothetical protein